MKWWDRMRWSSFFQCWVLSQLFQLSTCMFINKLFTFSSFSAIREVSSAYKRLLIFLPAVLIPAWTSSSLAFHMMYSAYKLNKQGKNIQPWHTPCPILNQPIVPYPVLTVTSSSAYKFLRTQVTWSGIPISLRIFHSFLWSTQLKALDSQWSRSRCFLEFPCFFYDPMDVGNLISGSSAFSFFFFFFLPFLNPGCIPGSSWFIYS